MKLISPQQAEAAAATRKAHQAAEDASAIKLAAIDQLNTTGQEFATELEQAIDLVGRPDTPSNAALSLVSLLLGTTDLIRAVTRNLRNGNTPEVPPELPVVRVRDIRLPAAARAIAADTGKKRGRGRPPGSKNKTTLEREAKERAAAKAAKALKAVKAKVVKTTKRTAVKGGRKKR
jgi:hypothetical protein